MTENIIRHQVPEEKLIAMESMLPKRSNRGRPEKVTFRDVMNATHFIMRTGTPWRDLPAHFGNWATIHSRFLIYSKQDTFEQIMNLLIAENADDEYVIMDGTYVRAHQHSSGEKKDSNTISRSRGGNTTKVHVAVDSNQRPLKVIITGGVVHDSVPANELISSLKETPAKFVLGDKGYDSNSIIEHARSQNLEPVIPSKSNRKIQRKTPNDIYGMRYKVEFFFNYLKQFRGIATRYQKLTATFSAFIYIVTIFSWL